MLKCYPFIDETSPLCDYEIETDRLCSQMGLAVALLPVDSVLSAQLVRLQELVYHANGSVRGKMALEEADLLWLHGECERPSVRRRGEFVLPAGCAAGAALHVARCQGKSVTRLLYKMRQQGIAVPERVIEFANLVANVLFFWALDVNAEQGFSEIVFISKSYPTAS